MKDNQINMAAQRITQSILLVLLIGLTISCNTTESNHEDRFYDGILIEVRELLGENILDMIENELDFPIHIITDSPYILTEIIGSGGNVLTVILDSTVLVKLNVANKN